jgi:hypothetical protein
MDFLKSHYEKVLLSLVLLGLAVVAALLPQKVGDAATPLGNIPNKGDLTLLPTESYERVTAKITNQGRTLLLHGGHNLFNPVLWMRNSQNGPLIKVDSPDKIGVRALIATNLNPLYLTISFDGTVGVGDNLRYNLGVTREAEADPRLRVTTSVKAALNEKRNLFTIVDLNGSPENPTSLLLELPNDQRVTVSPDKPFKAVEGYIVDLKYLPQNSMFYRKRDKLHSTRESEYTVAVAGETNNIVAINTNQIVLSAQSTGMRTTIPVR